MFCDNNRRRYYKFAMYVCSKPIAFYAEDVAHGELRLARSKHSNGICSGTKTEGGTTNLRRMCAVYQWLSMLRMWPIENCAWHGASTACEKNRRRYYKFAMYARSIPIAFYAEDAAHRELCLARSNHGNGTSSSTKTERGTTHHM